MLKKDYGTYSSGRTFRTLTLGLDLSEKTLAEARAFSSYEDMIEGGEIYAKEVLQWLNHPSIGKVIWFGLERGIPIFPELGCFWDRRLFNHRRIGLCSNRL